jgi:hypothetical protein
MWPVSQRYLDTLARSHTQLSYLEFLRDGDTFATMTSGVMRDPVTGSPVSSIGGSVQVDKTTIRRNCTISFVDVDGDLLPDSVEDLLAPFVTEIRAWVGVRYWDAPSRPASLHTSMRTNLLSNPSMTNDVLNWAALGTGATITRDLISGGGVTGLGFTGQPGAPSSRAGTLWPAGPGQAIAGGGTNPAMKVVVPSGNTTGGVISNVMPVTQGHIYTFSMKYRTLVNPSLPYTIYIQWLNSSLSVISQDAGTSISASTGGQFTNQNQLSVTGTAPTGAVAAFGYVVFSGIIANPATDTFWLDDGLFEEASSVGSFFTGDTPDTSTTSYAWTGTANASFSTATTIVAIAEPDSEYVPIGTFVITELDSSYPQIDVKGYDRMWLLGSFNQPYTIDGGTNVRDAIINLLIQAVPGGRLNYNIPDTEYTTPNPQLTFDVQTNIADAVHTLAQSAGWQIFVDPLGTFTATPEPSTDDDVVLTLQPGERSIMFRPKRSIAQGDVFNAVVFTGEGTGNAPVRGYAQDNDPDSLTYVGRIGVRTYFESSPIVTTQTQADTAAQTTLQRILGITDTISVPVIPIHALESGDVIRVIDPQQNIDARLIVDSFPVSLRAADGQQSLTCRQRVLRVTGGAVTSEDA